MKNLIIVLFVLSNLILKAQMSVDFSLEGIENQDVAFVTFGSSSYLETLEFNTDGNYTFTNLNAGNYFIKVESEGYSASNSIAVKIYEDGSVIPSGIELVLEKINIDGGIFNHTWTQDPSTSGNTKTAYVNTKPDIIFLGETVDAADEASADMLHFKYNIVLSNEQEKWTQEYAYRIQETMKQIPQETRETYQDSEGLISKWVLVDETIDNDIEVQYSSSGNLVRISKSAFVYASPQIVEIDGVRGSYFSKRLHSSLIRYITNFGNDYIAVEKILNERFGCSTNIPSYESLTQNSTNEDEFRFQSFAPEELIFIINMFEEMPKGFHVVDELNYLLRRKNGLIHPLSPEAPAVAWPGSGYIEFMESAFGPDIEHMFRLILHEKSHFLWAFVFSDETKNDWIEVGGWYENSDDPDGWSTTLQTEFVSAYAHSKNPNEDMAESVSYYLKNPDLLRSRSINKFEFIRDRIMHGTRYITTVPENLTFEVLNLFPDYDYPGKIKRIDVKVIGEPEQDKIVNVEIELENVEGYEDGASTAYMRVVSTQGTYFDLHVKPKNGNEHILTGTVSLSKHAKNGNWNVTQIVVKDIIGNARFEGADDFIWRMYVNNPLEDLISPQYVNETLEYSLQEIMEEDHLINELTITFEVDENLNMAQNGPVYITLANRSSEFQSSTGGKYGTFDEETRIGTIVFRFTEYMPIGEYYVSRIALTDEAKNKSNVFFSDSSLDQPIQVVTINSTDPDTTKPELDLNMISITAEPTQPEMPDGETIVAITYFARDNKSGLGQVNYRLRDPQGISHFEYHYHENFYTEYFEGDPTIWTEYTINIILPKGSAPGTWSLTSMNIRDKAWNSKGYDFTETVIFNVNDVSTSYNEILNEVSFNVFPNPTSGHVTIESTGIEIDDLKIFDSYGKSFNSEWNIYGENILINLDHLSQGIYYIQVIGKEKSLTKSVYLSK